jgi:o-aminophenol oxidase
VSEKREAQNAAQSVVGVLSVDNRHSGRYRYHCHILEHEDRDMMRPFVTMPPELMPFIA